LSQTPFRCLTLHTLRLASRRAQFRPVVIRDADLLPLEPERVADDDASYATSIAAIGKGRAVRVSLAGDDAKHQSIGGLRTIGYDDAPEISSTPSLLISAEN